MDSLISISDLKFRYPKGENWILDLPDLNLAAKEKAFLWGPSGSGKSTLLELIAGVLSPNQGKIKIAGQPMHQLSASDRDHFRGNHIGYIFQSFNLIPYLSIRQNIDLPMRLNQERRRRLKSSLTAETDRLAERLGLGAFLDQRVTDLSVGQQQRVAAARALIGSPELILADEPTSALDSDHREKFIRLLFEVADESGAGVLFVSHDRGLASLFDQRWDLAQLNRAVPC